MECIICRNPVFKIPAGENTCIDLCPNSKSEAEHSLCITCYYKLEKRSSNIKCPVCNELLNNISYRLLFGRSIGQCISCNNDMYLAGKYISLYNPPEFICESYGDNINGHSCICWGCILIDFIRKYNCPIFEEMETNNMIDWSNSLPLYADVMRGISEAEKYKDQLEKWIPNIPLKVNNTNLNKIMNNITQINEFMDFLNGLKVCSNGNNSIIPISIIKPIFKKKLYYFSIIDIRKNMLQIIHLLNPIIGCKNTSDIIWEYLMTND